MNVHSKVHFPKEKSSLSIAGCSMFSNRHSFYLSLSSNRLSNEGRITIYRRCHPQTLFGRPLATAPFQIADATRLCNISSQERMRPDVILSDLTRAIMIVS